MADLIARQIAALAPLGDVLVCGAALPAAGLARIEARRVIVMEADPVRYRGFLRQRGGGSAVEVVRAMAGKADAKVHLNRYNFRPASSLRSPTGIRDLFPGLHLRDRIEVRTRDVGEVAKRIRCEPGYGNMLILCTPGEEADILSRLKETKRLGAFDHILVPLPEVALYEGSACASEISDLLRSASYMLMARDDVDADVPLGHFYRSVAMQAELASRGSETESLRERLSKADVALQRAEDALEAERENAGIRNAAQMGRVRAEASRIAAQCRIVRTMLGPGAGA